MNVLLTKSKDAGAAIAGYRFVKPSGSNDNEVIQAAAATDSICGISDALGADSGGRCDVHFSGQPELELGGSVSAGDLLTSDADGKGVEAASGKRYGAMALVDGVDGDIIPVQSCYGVMNTVA